MSLCPVLIPVEQYLRTVYRPDCDYVDGEIEERNMGGKPHARLQPFFCEVFCIEKRIRDYALMGVPSSWVVDPWRRLTYAAEADGTLQPVTTLSVPNSGISLEVSTIFAELDRLEKRSLRV